MRYILPILAILILATACQPTQKSHDRAFVENLKIGNLSLQSSPLELTQEDGLALIDARKANSSIFTIKGVGIGSSLDQIIASWGKPSKLDSYPELGIVNLRYDRSDVPNVTIATFNIVNGSVYRIVLKDGANNLLKDGSKVLGTKDDIVKRFGKPDKEETTQFYTIYYYYPEGLEVYHLRKQIKGWGFVPPQPVPNITYNVTWKMPDAISNVNRTAANGTDE